MTLEHIGIAIADPSALALFESLLGASPYQAQVVDREGVRTVFFGDGGVAGAAPKLELLEATREDSPVATYLKKRGPGLHHLAFDVPDIRASMDHVRTLGIRMLADEPKPGADGKEIVFLHPKDTSGVLVELCADIEPSWTLLRVETPDGAVAVHSAGPEDAPVLLAMHGAYGAAAQLLPLTKRWAKRYRVLALDFIGHGASGAPVGPLSWDMFTRNAISALDAVGAETARVFGYSMGGGAALRLAGQHPLRVDSLALHATYTQWDPPMADRFLVGSGPETWPEDARKQLADWHGDGWLDVLERTEAFVRWLPGNQIGDDAIAAVVHSTLVSHGDSDALFPVEFGAHLFRTLQHGSLSVLAGAGHGLQSADLSLLAASVLAHFSRQA